MSSAYLVTNFAYGTGPYLRTTELAIAFNDELERRGKERLPFIVPLVYGNKQRRIMLEEFLEHDVAHPGEILLDDTLGDLLRSVFYGDNTYAEALAEWSANVRAISSEAQKHLSQPRIALQTLRGERVEIDPRKIVLELNRSPRIRYDVAPSYFTTFGYIEEILKGARRVGRQCINIDPHAIEKGIDAARWVESAQNMRAVAYPATFSGSDLYESWYADEILTPPIRPIPLENKEALGKGIFVTITGIPGLEELYKEAQDFGLLIYCNDMEAVPGSIRALPHIIPNEHVVFQFARSGWGSVWLSMMCGTPIVVPEYDPKDDPEIYFNNKMVEELGIGIIYRGQPLKEILSMRETVQKKCATMRERILARWGTLDGNQYCAKIFADNFLKS